MIKSKIISGSTEKVQKKLNAFLKTITSGIKIVSINTSSCFVPIPGESFGLELTVVVTYTE